jgi:HD-GYP domain-containing protein (c-di-GMP phosphodiesterase class II)
MLQISIVVDARARPEDLRREFSGRFDIAFIRLDELEASAPGAHTLFDIDLNDTSLIIKLKEWLKAKPQGAKVLFAADRSSRLQHTRAYALGATDVVERPVGAGALSKALNLGHGEPESEFAALADGSPEFTAKAAGGVKAAVGSLQDIFSSASVGAALEPDAVSAAGEAVVEDVEALGLADWIDMGRAHHSQTYQHCLLVTGVVVGFGQHIGLSRSDRRRLSFAGMLHDIGKARIPLAILEKPGPLTDEEREIIKLHPQHGVDALNEARDLPPEMLDLVLHHHELLDGTGYPHGLRGREISDLVRIMTISDIFGALIERRSYKPPLSGEAAYRILLDMGPKLDTDLVRAFRSVALGHAF